MSISSAVMQQPRDKGASLVRGTSKSVWLLPASIALAMLAYLPVLLVYLPQLWARQYYRFFPFAILATVALAIGRGTLRTRRVSIWRWSARGTVFVIAELCLLGGIRFGSPWPCFVGFVLTIGLLLDFWQDADSRRSLVYLILPMVLVIRPPLHLDETIIRNLQTVTSQLSSAVLTSLQVDHLLSGNVIEPVGGGPLLVEQACSGVQSLFTLMLIAAVICIYRRYTLFRTLCLIASSIVWALLMNVFRVVTIVLAQTEFQTDLSTGWQHETIGYIGILLAVVMLLSTDRLLAFLLGGIGDEPLMFPLINPFVSCWNWLMVSPELRSEGGLNAADGEADAARHSRGLRRYSSLAVVTAALVLTTVTAIPAWGLPGLGKTEDSIQALAQLQGVDASWLDVDQLPGCRLLNFSVTARTAESQFGQYSDEWVVSAPFGNVLHSMDHVFDTWHNLTACYRGIGWQLRRFEEKSMQDGEVSWPVAYAEFVKPTGEHAYLCFSLFTIDGRAILPEGETGGLAGARRRLRQSGIMGQPVVQVQSLNESIVGLSSDAVQQLVETHVIARAQLRDHVVRVMQSAGAPATAAATDNDTEIGGAE